MTNKLTSPVGNILFSRLKAPFKAREGANELEAKDDGKYILKLEIDGTTAEGKAFKEAISSVNSKIVTASETAGHYCVKARSQFPPNVFTVDGGTEKLAVEDIPLITGGTAIMTVSTSNKNPLGGSISLLNVVLGDITELEANGESAEERKARYAESIQAAINTLTGE